MKEAIAGLKDSPLWFLLGTAAAITAVYFVGPIFGQLPQQIRPYVAAAALVFWVIAIFRAAAMVIASQAAKAVVQSELYRARLNRIYRPIYLLFLDRHLTGATSIAAPRLRHRWVNAMETWKSRSMLGSKVRGAWRALGDRRISRAMEMEYGGSFPLLEIIDLVRENHEIADQRLMNLARSADRSQYEKRDRGLLTEEEMRLVDYVYEEHDRLSKRPLQPAKR